MSVWLLSNRYGNDTYIMANSKIKTAQHQKKLKYLWSLCPVAARSVAEQPRLLHRRLDGGEELYYNQAIVEPLIQCLIQQVPAVQRH